MGARGRPISICAAAGGLRPFLLFDKDPCDLGGSEAALAGCPLMQHDPVKVDLAQFDKEIFPERVQTGAGQCYGACILAGGEVMVL